MEDNGFEVMEIVVMIMAVAIPVLVGVLFGFYTQLKAKALESENKIDDKIFELVERFAARIVEAKQEDPVTPLGSGNDTLSGSG